MVQADRLQDLGLPDLVVHGPEVGRLEEARVGDGGGGMKPVGESPASTAQENNMVEVRGWPCGPQGEH